MMLMKNRSVSAFTLLAIMGSMALTPLDLEAETFVWDNAGADWNTAANWVPNFIPNSTTDTAIFSLPHITNPNISSSVILNSLVFSNGPYTLSANVGQKLTLDGVAPTIISSFQGSNTISNEVVLNAPTTITLSPGTLLWCSGVANVHANPVDVSTAILTIQQDSGVTGGVLSNGFAFASDTNTIVLSGSIENNTGAGFATAGPINNFSLTFAIDNGIITNFGTSEIAQQQGSGHYTININGGTLVNDAAGSGRIGEVFVGAAGSVATTMTGGLIQNLGLGHVNKVDATATGFSTFAMSGGTVINNNASASISYNEETTLPTHTTFTISGGDIENIQGTICTSRGVGGSTFLMTGGLVNNASGGLVSNATGTGGVTTATISGGQFNNSGSLSSNASTANGHTTLMISGGTISNTSGGTISSHPGASTANDVLTMTGGLLVNDGTSSVGSLLTQMTFSGGTLETFGNISATTYTQKNGANLIVDIASLASSGTVTVGGSSGTASLGGRLTAKSIAGFIPLPGNKVTFLTATNKIIGQFDQVVGMNLPSSIVPFAIYSPNSVSIGFSPTTPTYVSSYNEVMLTKINQHNVWISRHMHNLTRRYSGRERFAQMAAFDQDLPLEELVAENNEMEFLAAGEVRHQQERLIDKTRRTNRGGSCAPKRCRSKPAKPWDVYVGPIGSVGEVRSKGSQRGCDYTSIGGLAGFDYAFSSSGVGLLVDYQHIDGDAHKHWGDFDIDELQASFYGVWTPRCIQDLALGLIVGGGYEWYDIHRKTGVPGVRVTADGDPTGFDVDALVSMEYLFYKTWGSCQRRNIEFAPMVNLQYVYLHVDDYDEDGAGIFDLSVGSQSRNSLRSCLGFRLNTVWESCKSSFRPEINVGWQYEFLDDNDHLHFSPVNVVGITTATTAFGASPNTLLAGLDLLYTHRSGFQLEASYDFEYNDLFVNNEFYLGFGAEF